MYFIPDLGKQHTGAGLRLDETKASYDARPVCVEFSHESAKESVRVRERTVNSHGGGVSIPFSDVTPDHIQSMAVAWLKSVG